MTSVVMAATLVTVAVAAPVERINLALEAPVPIGATPERADDGYGALTAPTTPVPAGIPPDGATPATPDGRLDPESGETPDAVAPGMEPVPMAATPLGPTPATPDGRDPELAATPEAGETPALLEAMAPTAETVVPGREPLPAATPDGETIPEEIGETLALEDPWMAPTRADDDGTPEMAGEATADAGLEVVRAAALVDSAAAADAVL